MQTSRASQYILPLPITAISRHNGGILGIYVARYLRDTTAEKDTVITTRWQRQQSDDRDSRLSQSPPCIRVSSLRLPELSHFRWPVAVVDVAVVVGGETPFREFSSRSDRYRYRRKEVRRAIRNADAFVSRSVAKRAANFSETVASLRMHIDFHLSFDGSSAEHTSVLVSMYLRECAWDYSCLRHSILVSRLAS